MTIINTWLEPGAARWNIAKPSQWFLAWSKAVETAHRRLLLSKQQNHKSLVNLDRKESAYAQPSKHA